MTTETATFAAGDRVRINVPASRLHGRLATVDHVAPVRSLMYARRDSMLVRPDAEPGSPEAPVYVLFEQVERVDEIPGFYTGEWAETRDYAVASIAGCRHVMAVDAMAALSNWRELVDCESCRAVLADREQHVPPWPWTPDSGPSACAECGLDAELDENDLCDSCAQQARYDAVSADETPAWMIADLYGEAPLAVVYAADGLAALNEYADQEGYGGVYVMEATEPDSLVAPGARSRRARSPPRSPRSRSSSRDRVRRRARGLREPRRRDERPGRRAVGRVGLGRARRREREAVRREARSPVAAADRRLRPLLRAGARTMIGFELDDGGRAAAGFRGSAGDCVTRAVAIATGRPYRQVYDDLAELALAYGRRRRSARDGVAPAVYRTRCVYGYWQAP
jgi:hypothetical protein